MKTMRRIVWLSLAVFSTIGCATISQTRVPRQAQPTHEPRWNEWSLAAFEEAQTERKLLLVSVQAGWCHWCHVMNDTTYRDPRVLETLGRDYVVIRVDSDARPDLAERFRDYGWPATAILTPDARPIISLRGHQPSRRFAPLLERLASDLRAGRPLEQVTDVVTEDPALNDLATLEQTVREQLDGYYDANQGGWGNEQKYPVAEALEHALLRGLEDPAWLDRALKTLEGHAKLIDPVWGGMYQYSVGGTWDNPHFEKIAAIQAGAIDNFALAYRLTGEAQWLANARNIIRYVNGFLRDAQGMFYTSQDADVGTHGGASMHGPEYYALGNGERRAAGVPHVDRTTYANLNGMLIAAFAHLGAVDEDRAAVDHARAAAERVLATHRSPRGLVGHSRGDETIFHLPDQVELARGLLALHETTGEPLWLDEARKLVDRTLEALEAPDGGFFAHTPDPAAVGAFAERERPLGANARMARVLVDLHRRTGHEPYATSARRTLRALANRSQIREAGRMVGEYLLALEDLSRPYLVLSVVGPHGDQAADELYAAALRIAVRGRVAERGEPGRSRYPFPGRSAAFLCTENACSLPVFDPGRLPMAVQAFMATPE